MQSFERNGRTIHLIDTPGFDDNLRDDATILQELAFWLLQAHRTGFKLSGLVYLHRITDSRLQGSGLRSLEVLKAMCGHHCYHSIVMVTTRWDEVNGSVGCDHQAELVNNTAFWGDIIASGGRVMPLLWSNASALAIIDHILANPRRLTLNIQLELASGNTSLYDTTAGRIVYEEYRKLELQWDKEIQDLQIELAEAVREHHDRNQIECRSEIEELQTQVRAKKATLQTFRATSDQILSTWMQKVAQEMGALTIQARNEQQLKTLEESRLQFAKDSKHWSKNAPIVWTHTDNVTVIQAREQRKLSSHCFRDPQQVSAVAGVMGVWIALGSLAVAAAPLCTIM